MKGIAIILSACVLLTNAGKLLENIHLAENTAAMECCSDLGCSCCGTSDQHHDHSTPCSTDHDCTARCKCSSGHHFAVLAIGLLELNGVVVQSYHYGNYLNTYKFEYSGDFLRPPRMA